MSYVCKIISFYLPYISSRFSKACMKKKVRAVKLNVNFQYQSHAVSVAARNTNRDTITLVSFVE